MKITTRVIALLMVIAVLLTGICISATAQETSIQEVPVVQDKNFDIVNFLCLIGVLQEQQSTLSREITKGEFIEMLIGIFEIEAIEAERQLFFDVPLGSRYADAVNTAFELGIINGGSDGNLNADKILSMTDAVVMAVRALECNEIAVLNGGYPNGYLSFALKYDLLDEINGVSANVTFGDGARLIYNVLNAGILKTNDGKDFYFDKGDSILKSYFKIEKIRGIVDCVPNISIYGDDALDKGKISVSDVVYDNSDETFEKYIGYRVEAFISKDGSYEKIIYMYPYKNKEKIIEAERVESYKSGELVYIDDNHKRQDESMSVSALTLKNTDRITVPQNGIEIPKYGDFRLIDNNGDSSYDVIFITDLTLARVVADCGKSNKIYTNDTVFYSIELDEYDEYEICDVNGLIIEPSSIKEGSVISLYEKSDKSFLKATIYDNVEIIDVDGISQTEINGNSYTEIFDSEGNMRRTVVDFSSIYNQNIIAIGNKYEVICDENDKIIMVSKKVPSDSWELGYLIKWGRSGGLNDNLILKVYTAEGTFEEIECADRIKLNGISGSSQSDLLAKCEKSLIKYRKNSEGNIAGIDFPGSIESGWDFRVCGETGEGNRNITRYYSSTSLIGGQIAVGSDTLVFSIPKDVDDEDFYQVSNKSALVNRKYYKNAKAYITDNEALYAAAIVLGEDDNSIGTSSVKMFVTSIRNTWYENDDDYRKQVVGFVNGKLRSYFLGSKTTLSYKVSDNETIELSEGDVVQLSLDLHGDISNIKINFDQSKMKAIGVSYTSVDDIVYGSSSETIMNYGTLYEKKDGYYRFIPEGFSEPSKYYYPITSSTYVYQCDSSQSKKSGKRYEVITMNDAEAAKNIPGTEEKIFFMHGETSVPFIVIYK